MPFTHSRIKFFLNNISIPFFSHYWGSVFRKPLKNVPVPGRPNGFSAFSRIRSERGIVVSTVFALFFSGVLRIMDRVQRNVLPRESDTVGFNDSFNKDFTMISVTGAITAQVAITALALPQLNQVHWTANAGFVMSLVFSFISVWVTTTMSRLLSNLDTPQALRDWLSKPAPKVARIAFEEALKSRLDNANGASSDGIESIQAAIIKFLEDNKWKEASLYSCVMLAAPSLLLNWSVAIFLGALGIYLGPVWKKDLNPVAGSSASLAVMICYIIGATWGLGIFFGSSSRKDEETTFVRRWMEDIKTRSEMNVQNTDIETGAEPSRHVTRQQVTAEKMTEPSVKQAGTEETQRDNL